jgi:CRP-like cAMP-binding protein
MPEMSAVSNEKMEILRRVPLLAAVKDNVQALSHLAEAMEFRRYSAGHVMIQEGELGEEFYVLISGQVSVHKKTPDGDSYKVVILKAEMTPALGEGGLIEAEPRSATVICDQPCECLVLTRAAFLKFCDTYPGEAVPILKKIVLVLMTRLRQTSNDLMLLHKALMHEIRG